ncbi:MAG: class I mannose-6-phosphate isomerase [Sphingobium sp.]
MKLNTHLVEKPWGRIGLPAPFDRLSAASDRQIGEIWFEADGARPQELLVKYIFTSEKLSVQVHPNDLQGRARGLKGGKSECWYILAADEGATLGLGTREPMDAASLRAAALDGSIETLMDWKRVSPGDFFFVPAGTVHAIGAGISLVEIQQNIDVTYRLYDYGRPRELHLDDGVDVAAARPYPVEYASDIDRAASSRNDQILLDCSQFSVIYSTDLTRSRQLFMGRELWVVPLSGAALSGDDRAEPGECLWLAGDKALHGGDGTTALIGAAPLR